MTDETLAPATRGQAAAFNSASGDGDAEAIKQGSAIVRSLEEEVGRSIVGQQVLRRRLITGLITDGHLLLEGVPGLAKTLAIKALADALDASFKRIQFTPDLLPADLTGTEIYRVNDGTFDVRKGPVFANFVLADEINRAPAKVQSALLETMQERQVTIGESTFRVPDPFLVMATQNPIEQEGTYPLPEAQLDRFLMKVKVDYPSPEDELEILNRVVAPEFAHRERKPVVSLNQIAIIRQLSEKVYVDERVRKYIVNLVWATRDPQQFGLKIQPLIELGGSPRATISLFAASRAEAFLSGEHFVVPQNVKDIAADVLRHRIIPTYEAQAQGLDSDDIIKMVLDGVEVP